MSRFLTRAFQHALRLQLVPRPAVPAAEPAAPGVGRHPAAVAPVLARPISIYRPRPDDAASLQQGIRDAFRAARRFR